jgi:hypothetical protein
MLNSIPSLSLPPSHAYRDAAGGSMPSRPINIPLLGHTSTIKV